ncbi:peptide-N(4)-(N-acetyl-beta-glucosaminyl)asparagine amidase-like [Lineus longissimus]|uniref:peptide-N(4)-(N-acetyl-beta- glucosaminyl)asparagine amidase-like n=1 Tax=Lineus longissimus TaxID=88925 RepID=UPI002B4D29C7
MAPILGSNFTSVEELSTNTREVFLDATEILLRFAKNVLDQPNNEKFRKIRVANKHVQSKVLPVAGGMQCLFEMGFEEDTNGEFLNLPMTTSLDQLKAIREELLVRREKYGVKSNAASGERQEPYGAAAASGGNERNLELPSPAGATSTSVPSASASNVQGEPNDYMSRMSKELSFFTKMRTQLAQVLLYENPALQFMAKRCIPVEALQELATKKEQAMKEALKEGESNSKLPDLNDFILLELLTWFKSQFFSWVDAPPCEVCGGTPEACGSAEPTPEDLKYGASRVENYWCSKCRRYERFPRYNHPGKLLETKRGRCGEWANCFCQLCRALGFETRFVLDWTDHVWAEVYSHAQEKWLHCDPCENICDKPLTYEVGWGKKLSYVLAFSKDDIQDVTCRYTCNNEEILKRRTECREGWLAHQITKLCNDRQKSLTEERRKELQKRAVREIGEFFRPKNVKQGELEGRSSGSLAWRLARGETGASSTACKTGELFKLTAKERERKVFHLRYCCASDKYERIGDGSEMMGWDSCLFEVENVFRKEEHDWKMVYLARTEGSAAASIKWKFDFRESGLVVDHVTIKACSATYESGTIRWTLCSDASCVMLDGSSQIDTMDLSGSDVLTLTADMSGGNGDVAWQHTQLFRQGTEETAVHPLELRITFK